MFYVYVLKSKLSGKFYIGYSSNLGERIKYHNTGKNISIKYGTPWEIVYSEKFEEKKSAWLRERQIKSYKGSEAFKKLIK